jgi:hypothetical protein
MKRILLAIALVVSASILTVFAAETWNGKSPAEYASDTRSDLGGADRFFIKAVAQQDAIYEFEKNPKAYEGKRKSELHKLGQARALRHNLRASDALIYYVTFSRAIEALQTEHH